MKTVAIVYKTGSNTSAMNSIKADLEKIFEDHVNFFNVYLDEYPDNSVLRADAYLVRGDDLYEQLKERVDNFSMIIKLHRSPSTVIKLGQLLELDSEWLHKRIYRYLPKAMESGSSFYTNFTYDYLKSEMIKRVIDDSTIGTILVGSLFEPIYVNYKACSILGISDKSELNLKESIPQEVLQSADSSTARVAINLNYYLLNKDAITLADETIGYYITLQDERDTAPLRQSLKDKGYVANYRFEDIIYTSAYMKKVIDTAKRIAGTDLTVLIRGESGTGKEMIAQSIHNYSARSNFPFVAVNCAALPETLLESELFGYEPGSFTGARSKGKAGLFEQAHKGTIFLDEIGDVSPRLQSRLLRTIQEMQIMRIGSDKLISIDVRIIAATNRNLENEIAKSNFRNDLFFRLNVLSIYVPPLRKRKEDIPILLQSYLGAEYENISAHEKAILMKYDWPGNVRELSNTAVYYKALSQLPEYLTDPVSLQVERDDERMPDQNVGDRYQDITDDQPCHSDVKNRGSLFPPSDPKRYAVRKQALTEDELTQMVLSLICDYSSPAHGVGRTVILQLLKSSGVHISDGKLREVLASLASEDLIQIGKGRFGTRITEIGMDRLRRQF